MLQLEIPVNTGANWPPKIERTSSRSASHSQPSLPPEEPPRQSRHQSRGQQTTILDRLRISLVRGDTYMPVQGCSFHFSASCLSHELLFYCLHAAKFADTTSTFF
jgi:hypothetical protein